MQHTVKPFEPSPSLPPPSTSVGVVHWLRANLFSSIGNSLLTLAALYLLYLLIPPVFSWVFWDATWSGDTKQACAGNSGACWAFVSANFGQFMYGFYPEQQTWRIDLALVVFIAMMALFAIPKIPKLWTLAFIVLTYPVIAFYLFYGGAFGLVVVETHQWGGLFLTLVLSGVGITFSLPLGIFLALGRRSKMPLIKALCIGFIEVIRGVPLITILFMASVMLPLFLPEGMNFDKLMRALIGITLFQAAYMAEVIRGGLQAIPKGQYEAADALAMGYWKTNFLIILPQALRIVIPGIVNTFIELFKDTSLVAIVGLMDLLGRIRAATSDPNWLGTSIEGYAFSAFIYFVFCYGMSKYSMYLEVKLNAGRKR